MIGKVCSRVDTKTLEKGIKVSNFRLKTHDPYEQYHTINAFDKMSSSAENLKNGDILFVEGRVVTRKYKDKSGSTRYSTTINAARLCPVGDYKNESVSIKPETYINGDNEDEF